jgi:hypothetical protein
MPGHLFLFLFCFKIIVDFLHMGFLIIGIVVKYMA